MHTQLTFCSRENIQAVLCGNDEDELTWYLPDLVSKPGLGLSFQTYHQHISSCRVLRDKQVRFDNVTRGESGREEISSASHLRPNDKISFSIGIGR